MPLQHITQELRENIMKGYILNRKDEDVNKTILIDTHKKEETNKKDDNRHSYYYTQPEPANKIFYDNGPYHTNGDFGNFVNR